MKPHIRTYFKYFNIGEQDTIICEACGLEGRADGSGFDIHHIIKRSQLGKDNIENLMALCRKHHNMAHDEKVTKSVLQYIHNCFISGQRHVFIK